MSKGMTGGVRELVLALDRHTTLPLDLILFGGGAMALAYQSARPTEDLDILISPLELQVYAEAGFGEVLESANAELDPRGGYIRHLWSPQQEVLARDWEARVVCIEPWWPNPLLKLRALGTLDLIASKLARFDAVDREDIRHLIHGGWVRPEEWRALPARLLIPQAWEIEAAAIRRRAEQIARDGTC